MRTTTRLVRIAVSVAGLGLLSGCWTMPSGDPDRDGWNRDEHTISPANVATMAPVWTFDVGVAARVQSPVLSLGGVHVVSPCQLSTVDIGSGRLRWARSLADPGRCGGPTATTTLSAPFVVGGNVLVGVDRQAQLPGGAWTYAGSTAAFDARSGTDATTWIDGVLHSLKGDHTLVDSGEVVAGGAPVRHGHVQVQGSAPTRDIDGGVRYSTIDNGVMYVVDGGGARLRGYGTEGGVETCGPSGTTSCPWWTFTPDGDIVGRVVATGGAAWVGTTAGTVYLVYYDGSSVSTDVGAPVSAQPALYPGALAVPTTEGRIVVLDPYTLRELFVMDTGSTSPIRVQPVVGGGVLFAGSVDGHVWAFDANGCGSLTTCHPLWSADVHAEVSDAPVVDNGRLYVPTAAGTLVAFRPAPS